MPCSRMESASSRSASAEKSLRGWSGQGRIRSSGTRWTCSRVSGAGAGTGLEQGTERPAPGPVGSEPDCHPATRRGRVPKQVLPCAQDVKSSSKSQAQCLKSELAGASWHPLPNLPSRSADFPSAVSRLSKPAGRAIFNACRFRNRRYSRFGNPRYDADVRRARANRFPKVPWPNRCLML